MAAHRRRSGTLTRIVARFGVRDGGEAVDLFSFSYLLCLTMEIGSGVFGCSFRIFDHAFVVHRLHYVLFVRMHNGVELLERDRRRKREVTPSAPSSRLCTCSSETLDAD